MPREGAPGERIATRASPGLEERGERLAAYLAGLHASLEGSLSLTLAPVALLVLDEAEWRRHARYPYGLTFYRRLPGGEGLIFAPGHYPERLLLLLRRQVGAGAPGDVTDFLDLTLGHELGHAVADQAALRTRVRWLDEFIATYLYLLGLQGSDPALLERAAGWARAFSGSRDPQCALAAAGLAGDPAPRRDLGAFEYPLARLPLANQAWFQGRFTLWAADLLERRGAAFILDLMRELPGKNGRGAVHRSVVRLEPAFREWFRTLGNAA
ncbi:MAG TPA: hypothetical protein VNT60_05075 [Deinococcales bacterium]|nr:hypothetical protein [Deinococcales bacterium]